MAFPVKAEVKVDLPEPELPTNMVVLFKRYSDKLLMFINFLAETSKVLIPISVLIFISRT